MSLMVAGTRVREYRADTPGGLESWIADEGALLTEGWIPLTSDREPNGSLRVIYGDVRGAAEPPAAAGTDVPILRVTPKDVRLSGWATILALIAMLATLVLMALL
jgi:hypothetical protein